MSHRPKKKYNKEVKRGSPFNRFLKPPFQKMGKGMGISLPDKGQAADSRQEVSQAQHFSCLCTFWFRLVEAGFSSVFAGVWALCYRMRDCRSLNSCGLTFSSRTKTYIVAHTLCHFPVMQQNNFNPDIIVSGYTFADDSACVTKVDSKTCSITL